MAIPRILPGRIIGAAARAARVPAGENAPQQSTPREGLPRTGLGVQAPSAEMARAFAKRDAQPGTFVRNPLFQRPSATLFSENKKFPEEARMDLADSPHLDDAQRADMNRLIDVALAGTKRTADVAQYAYERLRESYPHRSGLSGLYYTHGRLHTFITIEEMTAEVNPMALTLHQLDDVLHKTNFFHTNSTMYSIPSFYMLMEFAEFSLDDVVFTTRESTRDELNDYHLQGKLVWRISLEDTVYFSHTDQNVHPIVSAVHDFYHNQSLAKVPSETRIFAARLYQRLNQVATAYHAENDFDDILHFLAQLNYDIRTTADVVDIVEYKLSNQFHMSHPALEEARAVIQIPTTGASGGTSPAIDWQEMAHNDPHEFLRQGYLVVRRLKQELREMIETGVPHHMIVDKQTAIVKEVEPISKGVKIIRKIKLATMPELDSLSHDFEHTLEDLVFVKELLESGDMDIVQLLLMPLAESSLSKIATSLGVMVRGRATIAFHSTEWLDVARLDHIEAFVRILENVAHNAAGNPYPDRKTTHMEITADRDRIIIRDNGKGMGPETVRAIREGLRVHNDKPALTNDPESEGHGSGWKSIRECCALLGIRWEISSIPGEGTTIILHLPEGFFRISG